MSPASRPLAQRVLLIGWDAADWQILHPLLDAGKMPHLRRLVEGGVSGSLRTLSVLLSPLIWTSIATGKRPPKHGVLGFVEPTEDQRALRPVQSTTRRVPALWNILHAAGLRCHAVGWYASHPPEAIGGVCVSNQFFVDAPGAVQPAELSASLADLRVAPSEITDAWLTDFIPSLPALNRAHPETQRLLEALRLRLAECATTHAIATALMAEEPWDFCTVFYDTIDTLGHEFMPYHPPRLPDVPPGTFAALCGVMESVYRLHDAMLGRLLELAGEDCHVLLVSDHGFLNGERRPGPGAGTAEWHRDQGILVAHGPGFRRDSVLHGAGVLDIAPTVLTLFGVPVGADMDGRVLLNAFERPPDFPRIDSHDPAFARALPPAAPAAPGDSGAALAALRQLAELGYIEEPSGDLQRDLDLALREQQFNLAASLFEAGDPRAALALAEQLSTGSPEERRYAILWAQCGVAARDPAAVARGLEQLERLDPGHRQVRLLRGLLADLLNDLPAALQHFRDAAAHAPHDPWLQSRLGRVHLRLRRWSDAEAAFRRALALDPEQAEGWYGLSVALPRQGRVEEGLEAGLNAIAFAPESFSSHFQVGAVLARLGWFERAVQAFEICLSIVPHFALAHRYLAHVLPRLGQVARARSHRATAARLLAEQVPQPSVD
ncbi:MAG: alkaline phosphatase family protein [Verrucomicrobia bacterium]|nr:alkaline phosphatase family protein [Verrucomicrobiota bacterium]